MSRAPLAGWILILFLTVLDVFGDLTNWTRVETPPLTSIEYGNGVFVALGYTLIGDAQTNRVMLSADGLEWRHKFVPLPQRLRQLTFGNNRFVAVGSGIIATSTNGYEWTPSSQSVGELRTVSFLNGKFVAAGYGAQSIFTSDDGISWSGVNLNVSYLYPFTSICFFNGKYFAVGNGGIWSSEELTNWSSAYLGNYSSFASSISGGPFGLVAVGGTVSYEGGGSGNHRLILRSDDGTNWSIVEYTSELNLNAVSYADGQYIAVADSGALVSSNGVNWSERSDFGGRALRHVGSRFISAGPWKIQIWDGKTNAVTCTSGTSLNLKLIARVQDRIVISSTNRWSQSLMSKDSTAWLSETTKAAQVLSAITAYNGKFLRVGDWGLLDYSEDGLRWDSRSFSSMLFLKCVTTFSNTCLIGGDGIWYSTDGSNFVQRASWTHDYIVHGDAGFVSGSARGSYGTSSNGWDWTIPRNEYGIGLFGGWGVSGAFGKGTYVSAGPYKQNTGTFPSSIWTSCDGLNWTNQIVGPAQNLNAVIFHGGNFIAVGNAGTVISSPDGTNWTTIASGVTNDLFGVAGADSSVFIVGSAGLILQSAPGAAGGSLSDTSCDGAGNMTMKVNGTEGFRYAVESKTNLDLFGEWKPVTIVSASNNSGAITLSNSAPQSFYRARLLP